MKKTAATLMLLAGLGGCASTDGKGTMGMKFNSPRKAAEVPNVVGPDGVPVMMTPQSVTATEQVTGKSVKKGSKIKSTDLKSVEVIPASATSVEDAMVQPTSGFSRIIGHSSNCDDCNAHLPGHGSNLHAGHGGHFGHMGGGGDPYAYGPMASGMAVKLGMAGVMPAPAMGPWGAVAAEGAIGPGSPYGPAISNQRTAIKFVGPERMKLSWLVGANYVDSGLIAPASYNFMQGNLYRLRLSGVPTQAGRTYYPTLEVAPATLKTITFLSHNSVPISFTNDDLERVNAGNLVVKVIYLPDPAFQDAAALGGAEEVVSTQLEPGADPILEATRRGTILAVIRLGNINLENPNSPAMEAVGGGAMPGGPIANGAPMMMPPPDAARGVPPRTMTVPAIPTSRTMTPAVPPMLPNIPQVR